MQLPKFLVIAFQLIHIYKYRKSFLCSCWRNITRSKTHFQGIWQVSPSCQLVPLAATSYIARRDAHRAGSAGPATPLELDSTEAYAESVTNDSFALNDSSNSVQKNLSFSHHLNPQKIHVHKPTSLKLLILNCQSIKNKQPEFETLIDSTKPDIIIGTESWLADSMLDAEYLPTDRYHPFRRDRDENGGGTFVLVSRQFVCTEIKVSNNPCELVFVEVKLTGSSNLIVGSFYRSQATDQAY